MAIQFRYINLEKKKSFCYVSNGFQQGHILPQVIMEHFRMQKTNSYSNWNKDGEQLLETGNSVVEYRNIRWSSNCQYLASANDALRIWDTNGQLIYESESTKDYLWGIDWNSHNSKIFPSSDQGVISIWDSKARLIKHLK